MTPPPADAVQIAAAVLGYETHSRPGAARDVVAALSARWAFVDREHLTALERAVRELVASANLVDDSAAAIVDRAPIDRLIALTTAPAAETGSGEACLTRRVWKDGDGHDVRGPWGPCATCPPRR